MFIHEKITIISLRGTIERHAIVILRLRVRFAYSTRNRGYCYFYFVIRIRLGISVQVHVISQPRCRFNSPKYSVRIGNLSVVSTPHILQHYHNMNVHHTSRPSDYRPKYFWHITREHNILYF